MPVVLAPRRIPRWSGPFVQGAGIPHNPTPGPEGSPHVYGHIWVVLGLLAVHPLWGAIALPLLARMYVRAKDLPAIYPQHRPEFEAQLAAEHVPKPGSGVSPLLAGEVDGDSQCSRDLLVPQAGELAELDHLGRDRVFLRQPTEGVVQGQEIFIRVGGRRVDQVHPTKVAAPLLPRLPPRGVDQDAPHGFGRRGEEVAPAVPLAAGGTVAMRRSRLSQPKKAPQRHNFERFGDH